MHLNIAFLETYGLLEAFLYKHLLVAWRNARSSGDEEGSAVRNGRAYCYGKAVNRVAPDESTKLRVRCDFLHQRNEWHNEATPLNVREP